MPLPASVSSRRIAAAMLATGCMAAAGLAAEPASAPAGSPPPPTKAPSQTPAAAPAKTPAAKPAPEAAAPPPAAEPGKAPDSPNLLLDGPPVGALPTPAAPAPSPNATINLIRLLVAKKILSAEEAKQMIDQAEAEAAEARIVADEAKAAAGSPDEVRVTYVPDVVKNDLRDQIKADLQADAREHGWMNDKQVADWTQSIKMFGDFRLRWEADLFPNGNDNTGAFPNFNTINTGSPFDVSGTQFSPQYNTDQDRNRFKLRARIGWDIDLADNWSGGFRFGTGESSTPISGNQGLGVANGGQGGNFSKYALWLDRAFLKYEIGSMLSNDLTFNFGRFDNPFFSTTAMWADEIGFDGLAIKGQARLADGFKIFGTGGAFPIFNTDLNFSSNQPAKFKSTDKYLYAAQLGADFRITKGTTAKIAAAYYDFDGVEGKLSTPFIPLTAQDQGDTDNTRPSFAKKGNTYRPLRNIIPSVINNFGTSLQYQYFGLASKFRDLAFTTRVDINDWEPYQLTLMGEYIKNTAFDRQAIDAVAVNNRGSSTTLNKNGAFDGGDTAWLIKAQFGKAAFEKKWDWNVSVDYRYLGSDAVIDAFPDDDFGGGGTNMEGFTIGGQLALSKKVRLGARFFSATQIAGPQFKSDIFMIDINAKF